MGEAFRLGGWGMYPTTFIGLVLLVAAVQYARHPDRRRRAITRHLTTMTLLSGVLGFVTGVIKSFIAVADLHGDDLRCAIVGFGESLNNVGLALVILILARIVLTLGAARDPDAASELVDPRG